MFANSFHFFSKLIAAEIVHLSQFIELPQREAGLSQLAKLGLAVVLRHILILFGRTLPYLTYDHSDIYAAGAAGTGVPAGGAAPGCPAGGAAPGAPPSAPSSADSSSPAVMSASRPAGVTPMARRS